MKYRLHIICAALVISLNCLKAQDHLPGQILSVLEDIAGFSGDDMQTAAYAEELTSLYEDPVNINSAGENELKRLFFLTAFQVRSIIDYRNTHGIILSALELSYLPGFDSDLASLVSTFATFDHFGIIKNTGKTRRMSLLVNFIPGDKNNGDAYTGSNFKLLSKARLSSGPFDAWLTLDKDTGEPLLLNGCKPDFLSAGVSFKTGNVIKKIIIGDYKVRFGQGLTACNGFVRSPVPTEGRLMKGNSDIIPYSSSGENDFFRGAAFTLGIRGLNINVFASGNLVDATIACGDTTGSRYISSFYEAGIHNTTTTLLKRKQVTENSLGININGIYKNLYCGLNAVHSSFSLPVKPSEDPRSEYDFRGRLNTTLSVDYACLWKDAFLFGEIALHNWNKTAFIQGLSLNPEGRVRFNLLYSRVNRGFNSFHGKAAGMSTYNRPGRSFVSNISFEVSPSFRLSAGILDRKELWYNNVSGGFPSSVMYMIRLNSDPAGFIHLSADIRHRRSDRWINPLQGVRQAIPLVKTNFRLSAETVITEQFTLRTRLEHVMLAGSTDKGFLCYQSAAYIFNRIPLEIRGRLTVFNIGSWETRIYAWEDDLLYSPYVKALYGTGRRSYVMITYRLAGRITLRARYAFTGTVDGRNDYCVTDELRFQMLVSL